MANNQTAQISVDIGFLNDSEMSKRFCDFDWSETPLGPVKAWPQSLKTAAQICLNSRFPMVVWWGAEFTFIYNDAYAPILGKRHPGALGCSANKVWAEVWPAVATQIDAVMQRGEASWNHRVHLAMERNGYPEDAWFSWSYSPIPDDKDGIGGVFCACVEETDLIQAERERDQLAAEREHLMRVVESGRSNLAAIIEEAPAFICTLRGPDHVFELANDRYYDMVGRREIIGKSALNALPELEGQGYIERLDEVYRTGKAFIGNEMSVLLSRTSGQPPLEIFVNFVYQALRGPDGKITGIITHGVDVTNLVHSREAARAARFEAEQAGRMKDEFLATLSHELRTPLNAILGWVQLIAMDRPGKNDIKKGIAVIERCALAQAQLIEDLLDMSRIISGKALLDVQLLEPSDIIEAAMDAIRSAAEAKNIRLIKKPGTLTGPISGDPHRLQQVILNLLSNAVKFTPAGGKVEVTLEQVKNNLEISVSDTGQGIKPELMPYLFERFRQGDGSTTRQHGGLGLGLAIVKQLVELHGGSVRAKSPGDGQGSTFIIHLPRMKVNAHSDDKSYEGRDWTTLPSERNPSKIADISSLKILVMDDELDARELMHRVLSGCNAQVHVAASAEEALQLLTELRPDIMLCDIGMPKMDGYEFIRKVRTLSIERGGATLAIALTAFARAEERTRALIAGYQSHIAKPVDMSELVAMIAALTRRTGI